MNNEDTIFLHALDLPAAERAAYLAEACAGQPELLARIERLLVASEGDDAILDHSPIDRAGFEGEEKVDEVIDRYRLVRRIGEGGCGVVWLAEQTEPVKRHVALKIIRLGMGTVDVIRRFEAERQALAMMDHPDIARVLDAGATATGRPFFAMEFVDGVPITTYCDDHQLGVPERLRLFMRVCEAIQHAHQKGIIHRDIKPSNVLVAEAEGAPALKVIDFGIAKAVEQPLTDATLVTQLGQFLGTPAYMSPEQSQLAGGDIDTRSDVYSLGVLLYELLAGAPPFEPKALLASGLEAMWKQIREVDPPRPSTRLQTLSPEELKTAASRRLADPPKLIHRVSGDLDWIVMRCLEKDRVRRYSSASGLAADIARHLIHEPIEARPASAGYRFAKLVRRHRLAVLAAAAVAVALLAGTVVSTWQALRANRAEHEARQEAAIATAVNAFLQTDLLRQADPSAQADTFETADPDLKVRDALQRAADNVGTRFADQPLTEAALRQSIGEAYLGLGLSAEASIHLERAWQLRCEQLGPDAPETLHSQNLLGSAWTDSGKIDEAVELMRALVKITDSSAVTEDLRIDATSSLALTLQRQGEFEESVVLFREVLARREKLDGPEGEKTLRAIRDLGSILYSMGEFAESAQLDRRALEVHRRVSGPNHPSTFAALNNLATVTREMGEYEQSTQLQEEAYALAKRVLGPEHQDTVVGMINLGGAYSALGQFDRAAAIEEEALEIARRVLGEEHQLTLTLMNNLASALARLGRGDEALAMREQMQGALAKAFGPDHPNTLLSMANLGNAYTSAGRFEEADRALTESWHRLQAKIGAEHPQTLAVMALVALNAMSSGDYEQALSQWQDCWDIRQRVLGPTHAKTVEVAERYAQTLGLMDRVAESVEAWRVVLDARRGQVGPEDPKLLTALAQLATACLAANDPAAAEPLLRELGGLRERLEPDAWTTFNTQSQLGGALLGLQRFAEAEPWLISGYEGLAARAASDDTALNLRLGEALDRLVSLYETWSRPEAAARWRQVRDAFAAQK